MSVSEIVTLILAIYGAVLSSILGFRALQKEKKQLRIFIDYIYYYEYPQMTLVNIGDRPITILHVSMVVGKHGDPVPANALFAEETPFPKTINEGEIVSVKMNPALNSAVLGGGKTLQIWIHDAEGKVYRNYIKRGRNARWGSYEKLT